MCICHISFLDSYRIGMARPQCCLSNQMTYATYGDFWIGIKNPNSGVFDKFKVF